MELVRRKLVESRVQARRAIDEGRVRVGGVAEPKASTLVTPAEPVTLRPAADVYVSRGGAKLAGALDEFGIDVAGRRCLDAGASTGGFTDCLLQRGADSVVAVDVGQGQLHWRLRTDPRVTVVERTNIRRADPASYGAPFDLVVADLSFISLSAVAGPLARAGTTDADWVLLVKPQFEAGKDRIPQGGVVRDPAVWREAVDQVVDGFAALGLGARGVVRSALVGASGNVEFLVWLRRGPAGVEPQDVARVVEEEM